LLASISPSRLTEEIFKIIYSPQAARIVEALDDRGLYEWIQPKAAKLMKENPLFRSRYLRSMTAAQTNKNLPGETLGALINDYLEDIADWEKSTSENYKECYSAARKFVLPMNPPRFELGYAVRRFFAAHGITIKKSHLVDVANPNPPPVRETEGGVVTPPRRKRRRRKKKVVVSE
jgi:poly(A) polymerase